MLQHNQKIKCTHCGSEVDVTDAMYKILEERYKEEYAQKIKNFEAQVEQKREEYKIAIASFHKDKAQFEQDKAELESKIQKNVSEKLVQEKLKLSQEIKAQVQQEHLVKEQLLQQELEEKSKELIEKSRLEAELEKTKREQKELEEKTKVRYEQQLSLKLQEERIELQKQIQSGYELRFKEQEMKMLELREQLKITQQKAEQGSQQMQGEVQELIIEEYLRAEFPLDEISEVKKGANGADVLQIVNTREAINAGKIYYESKRTKEFQPSWIEKLKVDMRAIGADVGVLVTQAMPKDIERIGLKNGVWVCSFEDFKILCNILRNHIISLSFAKQSNKNRDDKMSLLYDYLISNDFIMSVEAIVDSFAKMKDDLESEKRSMQRIWKSREKHIEIVTNSTISMYASIKGIAGNVIGNVQALELDYINEDIIN